MDSMPEQIDLQKAVEMVSRWDDVHQQQFYDLFPETVQQETRYDLMGFQQHEEDEGFATDLEGEEFNEREIDRATQQSLETQLANLSSTAGREAAAGQNLTVYNHAMSLWNHAEDTGELLEYLEAYVEERTNWNERDQLDPDRKPLQEPRVQYGSEEDQEYVEEILTQLVTETMHEV